MFSIRLEIVPDMDDPVNAGKDPRDLEATWVIDNVETLEQAEDMVELLNEKIADMTGQRPERLEA